MRPIINSFADRTRGRAPKPREVSLSTCSGKVVITNRLGLHARPAMAFVDCAGIYKASVRVQKGDQSVDGKSIMEMMMLAAVKGTQLEVICDGPDAQACLDALTQLVKAGFEED